jgi:SnoaL-like domain
MIVPPDVVQAISKKKAQYGRFIDTKQWASLNEVILPDCTLKFIDTDGSILKIGKTPLDFTSRDAMLSVFVSWFAKAETLHNFGPADLEYSNPDGNEVRAIWAMEDQLIFKGQFEIRGGGYYHETWILKENGWYLKSLRLERTYNKVTLVVRFLYLLDTLDPDNCVGERYEEGKDLNKLQCQHMMERPLDLSKYISHSDNSDNHLDSPARLALVASTMMVRTMTVIAAVSLRVRLLCRLAPVISYVMPYIISDV